MISKAFKFSISEFQNGTYCSANGQEKNHKKAERYDHENDQKWDWEYYTAQLIKDNNQPIKADKFILEFILKEIVGRPYKNFIDRFVVAVDFGIENPSRDFVDLPFLL